MLATGGFQANPEMRRLFQPAALADAPYYGVTTARGDGHVLGQAVGGQLINMTYIPMFVRAPSALVEDVIAVNLSGRRFHNEPGPYLERVAALESQPEGWGFYILDSVTAREKARMLAHVPGVPAEAPTLAELASIIGVSGDSLRTTVEEWNEQLARGDSDPFGRTVFPRERRGIVAPPFYAVKMVVGASFTAGGFRVSPRMDVLDFEGQPIEGLLAVGDCVGSVNAANGLGGVHLGAAATLGMVAGERAVELVEP